MAFFALSHPQINSSYVFFIFYQEGENYNHRIIIVVEPVGLVGNQGYAAVATDGLKAVGSLAVDSF